MIELRNVSKMYKGGTLAVDGVNLLVPEGKICALIGTSGCGKTTTLKMINRLIEPSSGEVLVGGELVQSLDPIELRRSIGYVVQRGALLPHLTVLENISLIQKLSGQSRQAYTRRAFELLETVGLNPAEFADRFPRQLSGGQQQRVGIARALVRNPPVLLMDEPFGALDPITRSTLHREMLELNRKLRKTIVIVTHDLGEAFKMADQIVLMSHGRIVQKGKKTDFLESPADDFTREFVSSQMEGFVS